MTTVDLPSVDRPGATDVEHPWHGPEVPEGILAQLPTRDPTVAIAAWIVALAAIVLF